MLKVRVEAVAAQEGWKMRGRIVNLVWFCPEPLQGLSHCRA
jgi:hypothetical protein